MIRPLLVLIVLVAVACGGAGPSDVDPATVQTWSRWATEAQQIAAVTRRAYQSRAVLPSQTAELQEQARTLAEEIRATDPSYELVLSVASDLDELVGALEFALEYAENSGVTGTVNVLPAVFDASSQLADDATALGETLETP